MTPDSTNAHWKIPSGDRDWRHFESGDFRFYYPEGYEVAALQASVFADSASRYLHRIFRHRLRARIPVFLFPSHQDFAANNMIPGDPGENTGGFTDFARSRVVIPFNGDYFQLKHVLIHEIIHAFQFDILHGENPGIFPPWLMEGMAEYLSVGWDNSGDIYIRDAVLRGTMPSLSELHAGRVQTPYMFYKGGQAVMFYIARNYGEERIGYFLKELKQSRNYSVAFKNAFEIDPEEFNERMMAWLNSRYASDIEKLPLMKDERLRDVTDYGERRYLNIRPAISPDGKSIAYISTDGIYPAIVIRKIPGPDVKTEKVKKVKVLIRAMEDQSYEEYHPLTTRLSFSPDGDEILLTGRSYGRQTLMIIDSDNGRIIDQKTLPFDSMQFPNFSPDGNRILFTGVIRGRADLYLLNRASGEIRRLTSDYRHESDGIFSGDGRYVYFSAVDSGQGHTSSIYRIDLQEKGADPFQVTDIRGLVKNPQISADGSLIVNSDHAGIPNLYRISYASRRGKPVTVGELIPVTYSPIGIMDSHTVVTSSGDEITAITELRNGASTIYILPSVVSPGTEGKSGDNEAAKVPSSTVYNPATYRFPMEIDPGIQAKIPEDKSYIPYMFREGVPFFMLTGATNSEGKAGIGAIAFAQLSDFKGDHRTSVYINYLDSPRIFNFDLKYEFLKHRTDFYVGAFHQTGNFAFFDFMALSLNQILYNPYYRILEQEASGLYAGAQYPIGKFSSVSATFTHGRNEIKFQQDLPGERAAEDIFHNFQSMTFQYNYDSAVYTLFGPLDGQRFTFSWSMPFRMTGDERELYVTMLDYSFYYHFDNFSAFALRFFSGATTGADGDLYPFRIGGYNTIRGYGFQEFEGRYAFFGSIEYRFPFVEYMRFAFPFHWDAGTVRGVFFLDAGSAFDYPDTYDAIGRDGRTKDLHMSIGAGLHWENFLWFLFPGAIMKIEWASPYDLKSSLPVTKWQGELSFGFNF